uniref:Uncharacterized protein n=1 Tax=Cacopsylla melanoneura TaxID=428564 RepID=A0A8D8XTL1_9HEMI
MLVLHAQFQETAYTPDSLARVPRSVSSIPLTPWEEYHTQFQETAYTPDSLARVPRSVSSNTPDSLARSSRSTEFSSRATIKERERWKRRLSDVCAVRLRRASRPRLKVQQPHRMRWLI